MGGDIFVTSEWSVGSNLFYPAGKNTEPGEPEKHWELDGLNALFVSDSQILNAVAQQKLEALGLRVLLASGGTVP